MPSLLARESNTDNDSTICSDCEDDIEGEPSEYTHPCLFVCFDGKTFVLNLSDCEDVSMLKKRISEKIGLLCSEFYIVLRNGSKPLNESSYLSWYGIQPFSTINVYK